MGDASAGDRARCWSYHAGARGCRRLRAARPAARRADGGRELLAPSYRHRRGCGQAPRGRPRSQGHQAVQHSAEPHDRRGEAHRIRHRLAPTARAAGPRTARGHRRDARLYGARADGADEPLDRFPQRPLRPRRHVLPDADRRPAVQRGRSDGMGSLPHRAKACGAFGTAGERSGRTLRDRHEAPRQDGRGSLPDRRRPRARSAALTRRMGAPRAHRGVCSANATGPIGS